MTYAELYMNGVGADTRSRSELYHHGIKGQKWGIRRFQNPDGTLTELGKKRYGSLTDKMNEYYKKGDLKNAAKLAVAAGRLKSKSADDVAESYNKKAKDLQEEIDVSKKEQNIKDNPSTMEELQQRRDFEESTTEKRAEIEKYQKVAEKVLTDFGSTAVQMKGLPEEVKEGIRNKAVQSGDAAFVAKYRKFLTNAELKEAINRVDNDKKIREMAAATKDKHVGEAVDTAFKWLDRGIKGYNYYAAYTQWAEERDKKSASGSNAKPFFKTNIGGNKK
jgi:hypothetical protein